MKVIFLVLFILTVSAVTFAAENMQADSLIVGKNYTIGTKQKQQYEGTLLKTDSASLIIKTIDGNIKLRLSDIEIYQIKKDVVDEDDRINVDTVKYVTIETKDNNEITGQIISRDSASIVLKTGSGVIMTIPVNQILSIKKSVIEYENGQYFIKDPNETRLFICPTAKALRGSTGYLSVVEVLFPIAAVGIADYVTIAGGISIVPFSSSQLIYINTKVTPIQEKNVDIALGYMFLNTTSKNSNGISLPYAVGTFGSRDASVTTGMGIGFSKSSDSELMFLLGGELRAANNVKFLTENWIFTGRNSSEYNFSFVGVRFFGSKLAADFALLYIWGTGNNNDSWPFIPYVSFTYNLDFN